MLFLLILSGFGVDLRKICCLSVLSGQYVLDR